MSEETAPRTKLDFIYQEVLGEAADLVKRLEAISATLREVASSSAAERTVEALERAAVEGAWRVRREIERVGEAERHRFTVLVEEAVSAAEAVIAATRWKVLAGTAAVCLVAAFLGGAAALLLQRAAG
jgi:ElaB/YqjD/DUF883 family membrane-anchored ribosome-binding protein